MLIRTEKVFERIQELTEVLDSHLIAEAVVQDAAVDDARRAALSHLESHLEDLVWRAMKRRQEVKR